MKIGPFFLLLSVVGFALPAAEPVPDLAAYRERNKTRSKIVRYQQRTKTGINDLAYLGCSSRDESAPLRELLAAYPCLVIQQDAYGNTPLMHALVYGTHRENFKVLREAPLADLNIKNDAGYTASDMFNRLGATLGLPNSRLDTRLTPLAPQVKYFTVAVDDDSPAIFKIMAPCRLREDNETREEFAAMLRSPGVDVNAMDAAGNHVWLLLTHFDPAWYVDELLAAGANPYMPLPGCAEGVTAFHYFFAEHLCDMCEALLKNGYQLPQQPMARFRMLYDTAKKHECGLAISSLELLRQYGVNLDTPNPSTGLTVLQTLLAEEADWQFIENMLEAGTQPNAHEHGDAPLEMALARQNAFAVRTLLNHGAEIPRDDMKQPLLMVAVRLGDAALAARLLQAGALPTAVEPATGLTPLKIALRIGNEELTAVLMEAAQGNLRHNNAFFDICQAAIAQGDVAFFAGLPDAYLDDPCGAIDSPFAEVDGNPKATHYFAAPLLHAAAAGKTDIVRVLLQRGANREGAEYYDRTAIVYAAANGHLPCVQVLHQAGANKADVALQAALHFKHRHVAEYLQSNGGQLPAVGDVSLSLAQRTPTGETVLMQAVQSGLVEHVAYVLENAPHWVNCQNSYGRTALMMARDAEIARLLLNYGADASIKDDLGYTSLDHAFERRAAEVVQLLRAVEAPCAQASPALLYACYTADAALARRVLAEHPVDVNRRDAHGQSLLFLAVRSRSAELVRLLLDAGARVEGSGALEVAIAHDDVNWVREFMWRDSVTMKAGVFAAQGNPKQRHLNAMLQLAQLKRAVNTQKMLIGMGADKCREWIIIPLPNFNRYKCVDPNAVYLPESRYDEPGLTLNFEREDARGSQALPMLEVAESGAVQMDTRRLYDAIVKNDVSMVRMLVRSGGGFCASGSETVACLRAALRGASPHEMLPLLMQAGADINAVDAEGNTLLILLALDSYRESELLNLLAYSPNVNAQKDGKSVFDIAFEHKRLLFALHILRNGAELTQHQLQCFFFAVLREHPEHAAELLTRHGASPSDPEPTTGLTPMDIATRSGNAELIFILKAAMNN